MTLIAYLDGVPVTLPNWMLRGGTDLQLSQDASGGGSFGSFMVEDPNGTQRIQGWQQFAVDETACTSAPRIQTNYIGQRTYSRGPTQDGSTFRHGAARVIQSELYDLNVLLSTRLITGGDAVRPAETDTARMAWLLGSDYLTGLVYNSAGLVSTTGLMFDAANYHGQYPADVLQDMTSTYDQIFFVIWDQTNRKPSLFFDFPDSTTYTSTLSISNVNADVVGGGGLVIPPYIDAALTADPAQVYSNVRYAYSGGQVYLTRQATADQFFTTNGFLRRGVQAGLDKIGKLTTATTFATRYLDAVSTERLAITCTVQLTAAQVNLIDAGMRLQVKFSHLPDYGFNSYTYTRVQGRTVTQSRMSPNDLYDVTLTLALTGIHNAPSGGGGGVPQQPSSTAGVVQTGCGSNLGSSVDLIFPSPITAGHMLVAFIVSRGSSTSVGPPDGSWSTAASGDLSTGLSQSPLAMFYKIADSTEAGQTSLQFTSSNGSSRPKILGWELSNVGLPTSIVSSFIQTGSSGSLPALTTSTSSGIAIGGISTGSDNPEPATLTPDDHFYVEAGDHFWATALGADRVPTATSLTFSFTFTVSGGGALWAGIGAYFPTSRPDEGPQHGTWSEWATVTVTAGAGNIGFAYATGSLEIKVDGVLISPASYVETDNTTGAFTLNWSTDSDEVVTARAQGI